MGNWGLVEKNAEFWNHKNTWDRARRRTWRFGHSNKFLVHRSEKSGVRVKSDEKKEPRRQKAGRGNTGYPETAGRGGEKTRVYMKGGKKCGEAAWG